MEKDKKLLDTSLAVSSSSFIETVTKKPIWQSGAIEKLSLGESKCLFCWILDEQSNLCAARTLYAESDKVHTSYVSQFTEVLQTKALKLNET